VAAKIRRNDEVLVTTGKDRGRRGSVRQVLPKANRAIVTGINMVKKHRRSTGPQQPGGIFELEAPIALSNLAVICSVCSQPTRIGFRILEDGRKVRTCKKCDEVID
jgi:large subunit ribosomal protein L24